MSKNVVYVMLQEANIFRVHISHLVCMLKSY